MGLVQAARCLLFVTLLSPNLVFTAVVGGISNDVEEEEEVMALPDDVIIDALFTNIDTVQDQVELCEEGLRQKLMMASGGKLPYVEDFDDMINKTTTRATNHKGFEAGDQNNDHTHRDISSDDNGTDDANGDEVDQDLVDKESSLQHSTRVKLTHANTQTAHHRRRRAARQSQGETDREDEEREHDEESERQTEQPHPHQVGPTEAVVNRLSERLDYLKKTLLSCYSLYKQL